MSDLPKMFWTGHSCPECGSELQIADNGDGFIYDGDECTCPECTFASMMSVDENGGVWVQEAEEAEK